MKTAANIFLTLLVACTLLFFSAQHSGRTDFKSLVATAYAVNSLDRNADHSVHKFKRSECPHCHGTGKLKSGDGLFTQDCPYCEPDNKSNEESSFGRPKVDESRHEQLSNEGLAIVLGHVTGGDAQETLDEKSAAKPILPLTEVVVAPIIHSEAKASAEAAQTPKTVVGVVTYDRKGNVRSLKDILSQRDNFHAKNLKWNTTDGKCNPDCSCGEACTCEWPLQCEGLTYEQAKERFGKEYTKKGIRKVTQNKEVADAPIAQSKQADPWDLQRKDFEEKHLKWQTPNGKCSPDCICKGKCCCMYPWQCLGLSHEESMARLKKLNAERAKKTQAAQLNNFNSNGRNGNCPGGVCPINQGNSKGGGCSTGNCGGGGSCGSCGSCGRGGGFF